VSLSASKVEKFRK